MAEIHQKPSPVRFFASKVDLTAGNKRFSCVCQYFEVLIVRERIKKKGYGRKQRSYVISWRIYPHGRGRHFYTRNISFHRSPLLSVSINLLRLGLVAENNSSDHCCCVYAGTKREKVLPRKTIRVRPCLNHYTPRVSANFYVQKQWEPVSPTPYHACLLFQIASCFAHGITTIRFLIRIFTINTRAPTRRIVGTERSHRTTCEHVRIVTATRPRVALQPFLWL